jgi:hypothetical protein
MDKGVDFEFAGVGFDAGASEDVAGVPEFINCGLDGEAIAWASWEAEDASAALGGDGADVAVVVRAPLREVGFDGGGADPAAACEPCAEEIDIGGIGVDGRLAWFDVELELIAHVACDCSKRAMKLERIARAVSIWTACAIIFQTRPGLPTKR